jgi:hypothetical protein
MTGNVSKKDLLEDMCHSEPIHAVAETIEAANQESSGHK